MKQFHKRKFFLFTICIAFSTALFLIHSPTSISNMDTGAKYSKTTHTQSNETNMKKTETTAQTAVHNNEIQNDAIPTLTDISLQSHADQQIALLQENGTDNSVISRGTSRDFLSYEENTVNINIQEESASTSEAISDGSPPYDSSVLDVSKLSDSSSIAPSVNATSDMDSQDVPTKAEKTDSQYEKNLDLLARLITAEAQGEPYDAKVAVGAVVINRVESNDWASTITGVIYQKINGYYQFTPVENGWINKPADSESIKAAKAALSGDDPTNGAQFYYDDKATNTWILSKPVSIQIGHLIYAFQ